MNTCKIVSVFLICLFFTTKTTRCFAQEGLRIPDIIQQMPRCEIEVELVPHADLVHHFTTVIVIRFVNFHETSIRDAWIELIDSNGSVLARLYAPPIFDNDTWVVTALFPGAHNDVTVGGIIECKDQRNHIVFRRGINRILTKDEQNINREIEPRPARQRIQRQIPAPTREPVHFIPTYGVHELG